MGGQTDLGWCVEGLKCFMDIQKMILRARKDCNGKRKERYDNFEQQYLDIMKEKLDLQCDNAESEARRRKHLRTEQKKSKLEEMEAQASLGSCNLEEACDGNLGYDGFAEEKEEEEDDNDNNSGKTQETETGGAAGGDNEETPKNITPL